MKLKVEIRRNSDGEIATTTWPNWPWNEYWWVDGNAGCDCNREIFFLQAKGENTDEDEQECGTGAYAVRLTDADTGKVLRDEFGTQSGAPL